ncbi:hypothetical protein JB92DRAFT_2750237 [Gautieria morchelliformis]|nr:hypothetical protein JB92DRAFT_2750237 [Gautieria morchelliformis]
MTLLERFMEYDNKKRIVSTRFPIPFIICGVETKAEVDIYVAMKSSNILLLLQEDKRLENDKDPEAQVIAEAIAAFQENSKIRSKNYQEHLDKMIFPCITMIGTFPIFYLVPVTRELNECVKRGLYPENITTIYRHTPTVPHDRHPLPGMMARHWLH